MHFSESTLNQPLRDITVQSPNVLPVFESLGIDYCCGGNRTLAEACDRASVSRDRVLTELLKLSDAPATSQPVSAATSLEAQISHVLATHHTYVRRAGTRLEELLRKVIARHGAQHPELGRIGEVFTALHRELRQHMEREENVLFPMIIQLERESALHQRDEGFRDIGLAIPLRFPVAQMEAEHEAAGDQLTQLRVLSSEYRVPPDGCASYRALYQGLEEFERDLHQHVHLENNLLFPQAVALEQSKV